MSGISISINGDFMDVFQGTLPVSYIHQELEVPSMTSNSSYEAHFDFSIPPEITIPMFYVSYENNRNLNASLYYFTHLGGLNWRLTFWGVGRINTYLNKWETNWTEPLVKAGTKLIIGGYRG